MPHEKLRCLDTETSGLDWKTNAIVGYVLSFGPAPQDSYYVPFRHAGTANVGGREGLKSLTGWDRKLAPGERELVQAIDQQGTLVFGHNLAFDLRFMAGVNFTMKPRFEDTMINAPLLDEYVGRYSLESCAHRHQVQAKKSAEIKAYLRSKFPEIKSDNEAMGHFWRLSGDDPMAVEYASGDGTTTWQLRDAQMEEIRAQEMELTHSVESRCIPVLARMMIRGVKVNEEYVGWLLDPRKKGSVAWQIERLHEEFPDGFNALSKVDVRAWMEKHGVTDWPYTAPSRQFPQGQPSFNAAWLEESEPGKKIIKLRKMENLVSSFITPLRERHLFNGRVHTTFNQLRTDDFGTVTGRLSSNDPNMQQVPKHDEELGALYRAAFVPEFGLWGERDYSQIEPRLMAYYTRARVFLSDYRTNPEADSHTAVARSSRADWDSLSKSEQKHVRNTWAKRVNQTVITGGGKRALMHKYKMTEMEAQRALNLYHRTVPELKPFQKKAARLYRERGYVLSLLGARCRLDDPDRDYTAMNRLLQRGNADMLKLKMVEVDEFLESERKGGRRAPVEMLLNCHDALSFQFLPEARSIYDRVKTIMEDFSSPDAVIKLDLPIRVDEGEGKNWGEATYGES